MEKLIELLNEHAHTYADHYDDTGEEITIEFYGHADECFQYTCDGSYETLVDDVVISKRFGFISWLVENDKIDIEKLEEKAERKPHYIFTTDDGRLGFKLFEVYESLLMLLSISSSPIEDLISYLR